MNILELIQSEMATDEVDTDRESERLIDWFDSLPNDQQAAVNLAFTYVCGWTLETLREKVQ
ncbi:MAG: hypothetical protein Q7P63_12230 [Verrucomicrobiota bacterium JB022]|nr:hypothetical protein [Verrucomicrobiota bacterium JB022]